MRRRAVLGAAFTGLAPLVLGGKGLTALTPEASAAESPLASGETGLTPLTPLPYEGRGEQPPFAGGETREGLPAAEGRTVRFPEVGAEVAVEVADTPEARALGLGGHAPLEDGQGMLFVFGARGRFPFWMKGMTFPLDMLWLDASPDSDGSLVVVHVARDVAPDPPGTPDAARATFGPPPGVMGAFVLEVPAGWAATWGVDVGASALWL